MDTKRNDVDQPTGKPIVRLVKSQKIRLFRSFVLDRDIHEMAVTAGLKQLHIQTQMDDLEVYGLLYRALTYYYSDYPKRVKVHGPNSHFLDYLEQYKDRLRFGVSDLRLVKHFLKTYCAPREGRAPKPLGPEQAREFITQYIGFSELKEATNRLQDDDLTQDQIRELADSIDVLHERLVSNRIAVVSQTDSLTDTSLEEMSQRAAVTSSGLHWLNKFMDGGVSARECYGFVGPPGSCKTTFASMIACEMAQREAIAAEDANQPSRVVYYFSWEETRLEAAARMFSYLGNIHRSSFVVRAGADGQPTSNLSDTFSSMRRGDYKPYELSEFSQHSEEDFPGELERFENVRARVGDTLKFIDMTDPKSPWYSYGNDGVRGILSVIKQSQRNLGNPGVACVLVDYVNRAVRRMMETHNIPGDQIRHHAGPFPGTFKDKILTPFNCHGWLVQQASTTVIGKNPGVIPTQGEAAEAKNFTENLAFGFAVGTKSTTGHCVFVPTKQRRSATSPPIVVKIHNKYNRVDPDNSMRIANGRLINMNEVMDGMAMHSIEERYSADDGLGPQDSSRPPIHPNVLNANQRRQLATEDLRDV